MQELIRALSEKLQKLTSALNSKKTRRTHAVICARLADGSREALTITEICCPDGSVTYEARDSVGNIQTGYTKVAGEECCTGASGAAAASSGAATSNEISKRTARMEFEDSTISMADADPQGVITGAFIAQTPNLTLASVDDENYDDIGGAINANGYEVPEDGRYKTTMVTKANALNTVTGAPTGTSLPVNPAIRINGIAPTGYEDYAAMTDAVNISGTRIDTYKMDAGDVMSFDMLVIGNAASQFNLADSHLIVEKVA